MGTAVRSSVAGGVRIPSLLLESYSFKGDPRHYRGSTTDSRISVQVEGWEWLKITDFCLSRLAPARLQGFRDGIYAMTLKAQVAGFDGFRA